MNASPAFNVNGYVGITSECLKIDSHITSASQIIKATIKCLFFTRPA